MNRFYPKDSGFFKFGYGLAALWTLMLLLTALPGLAEGAETAAPGPELAIPQESALRRYLADRFGYTPEEAAAFQFSEASEQVVRGRLPESPNWNYLFFLKDDGASFASYYGDEDSFAAYSPFLSPMWNDNPLNWPCPGEGALRAALRKAEDAGWFSAWSESSRKALVAYLEEAEIAPAYELLSENVAAPQAVHALFVTALGQVSQWTPAAYQWRNQVLEANGLSAALIQEYPAGETGSFLQRIPVEGVRQTGADTDSAIYFEGMPPLALRDVLRQDSRLEGWTLLSGILFERDGESLIAYGKGDERLLLALCWEKEEDTWQVYRVGGQVLFPGREIKITLDETYFGRGNFVLNYPSEEGCLRFFLTLRKTEFGCLCELTGCYSVNPVQGEGWYLGYDPRYPNELTLLQRDGSREKETVAALPVYLDEVQIDQFPLTPEAIRAYSGDTLPEGYGVAGEVHFRQQTSSRSRDLGTFYDGALLEILDILPGDPYPWVAVQCGKIEGYAVRNYVDCLPGDFAYEAPQVNPPLPVARTEKKISLRQNTGLFSPSVMELPAGTAMHALLQNGDWLYVAVPREEIGWYMDVNGTYGYVRRDEVKMYATPFQMQWDSANE